MQGFNMGRYRPPSDLDSALSTSTNATGTRSTPKPKTTPSAPTVRFEMPFAIWCSTCPSPSTTALIGQGVRFNALKKRIGSYYSSPIWSFRMKHTACGGWLELRTDPQHSDFVVAEGAKKRDYGDDAVVGERDGALLLSRVRPGDGPGGVEAEREMKRQDAFVAFEGKAAEKLQKRTDGERVEDLRAMKERDWRDVDAAGARLRKGFRVGRKERQAEGGRKQEIRERMGLGIELLDESEGDRRRAKLVDFGAAAEVGNSGSRAPLFTSGAAGPPMNGTTARRKPEKRIDALRDELSENTRAALDPFASNAGTGLGARPALPGIKRKRQDLPSSDQEQALLAVPGEQSRATSLVAYDSD